MGIFEHLIDQMFGLKMSLSVSRHLYCLYLLNKWSLLRMDLLMSCVINCSDDLVLIVRWGTYCSIPLRTAFLKSSQSELTVLSSQVDKNNFWNANMCVSKPSQSAFLYMNISLGFCLEIWGFIKTSERRESWSAMQGLTSTDLTKVLLSMRNKFRVFLFLVRWVTICVRSNSLSSSEKSSYWLVYLQSGEMRGTQSFHVNFG